MKLDSKTWEGLGLAYVDGSYTPLMTPNGGSMSLEKAREERKLSDKNEDDPDLLTNIVTLRIEELEMVERYRGEPIPDEPKAREKMLADASVAELEAALKAKRAHRGLGTSGASDAQDLKGK